ncbi:MAG TPA: hypothetical protein VFB63_13365 [Bryobacteraceae bacterium]|nr:hypothetical protein [Bryobacteraceae bacterium]
MSSTTKVAACAALLASGVLLTAWSDTAEDDPVTGLLLVKRLYVEKLHGGESAGQIRDMIVNSLQRSRLFVITENEERADAALKGSAEDMIFTDTFQTSEGVNGRASFSGGTDRQSGSSYTKGPSMSAGVGDSESTRIAERKHEALAAVRIVAKNGDVIWATTQESMGAKFRGASADVAEKVLKQLLADYQRAKGIRPGTLSGRGREPAFVSKSDQK